MPLTEQVDGKFYESKSKFRAVGKSLGLIEVATKNHNPRSGQARIRLSVGNASNS